MRKLLLSAALLTGLTSQAFAEVSISADVVSQYLFRGKAESGAMSVQPTINYSTGTLNIGTWLLVVSMGLMKKPIFTLA